MCRNVFKHILIFCWGFGKAGALKTVIFSNLRKTPNQNHKDSKQNWEESSLWWPSTQCLTLFDLPMALPIRAVQGERFLKQRTSLQVKIVTIKKNEENKPSTDRIFCSLPCLKAKWALSTPKRGFSADCFYMWAPRERRKMPLEGIFQSFMESVSLQSMPIKWRIKKNKEELIFSLSFL